MILLDSDELQKTFENNKFYPQWSYESLANSIHNALCQKNNLVLEELESWKILQIMNENNWSSSDSLERTSNYFNIGIAKLLSDHEAKNKTSPSWQNLPVYREYKETSILTEIRQDKDETRGLKSIIKTIRKFYSR